MKVIPRGYTVIAVLRKEHGSKMGTLHFTEGKANNTSKKCKKKTKEKDYTSHK